MSETGAEARKNPRRLWPWVVGTVALCLFAAGFSISSRIQRAGQLAEFASTDNGYPYIDYQHPDWINHFVDRETYLPWYDKFYGCVVRTEPISEDLFYTLCTETELNELALDISKCSPKSISLLEHQPKLYTIELKGAREEIPLEWLKSMSNLKQVIFKEIPVPAERWPDLLSYSGLNCLRVREKSLSFADTSRALGPGLALSLERDELTQTEAEAINALTDLKRLTLVYMTSTPGFWSTLSRHKQLESLTIEARSSSSPVELTNFELDHIQGISTLTELHVAIGPARKVELEASARNEFVQNRPDVSLSEDAPSPMYDRHESP